MNPDDLDVGDAFETPTGGVLVVAGVCPVEQAPSEYIDDGPLYEVEIRHGTDDGPHRHLYRPHNIETGLGDGVEYVGTRDVEETEPFWCDGCLYPHKGADRREVLGVKGAFCSRSCGTRVHQRRHKAKIEAREGGDR